MLETSLPNVWRSSAPYRSLASERMPGAYFCDAWTTLAAYPGMDPLAQYLRVARRTPAWIENLMRLRNRMVAWVGLKDLGAMSALDLERSSTDYSRGDRVGIFTLLDRTENEVVLGDNDRHLDVLVSVHMRRNPPTGQTLVTVTTVVHVHNLLGRLYMIPVRPAHYLIARAMTAAVGQRDGQ